MKVFAGTYQGSIVILQGDHTNLQFRATRQVSENSIRSIALAQDQLLVGGYDQQLKAINSFTGHQDRQSKESLGVINCIKNIDEKLAVIGLENGTIRFWDKVSWAPRKDIREHKKAVTDIQVDKKGILMVSVGGHEIILWNLSIMKSIYHYRFQFQSEHALLSDDFQYIYLIGDRTIRAILTANNTQIFKIEVNQKIQCGLIFQGYLLIATEKGEIKIYSNKNASQCIHFKAHTGRIKDMKSLHLEEADYLITADANGQISVWDILQFLKGVDSITQDYNLEGLKPLTSIQIKQRIICIQVAPLTNLQPQPSRKKTKEVQPSLKKHELKQKRQQSNNPIQNKKKNKNKNKNKDKNNDKNKDNNKNKPIQKEAKLAIKHKNKKGK